MHPGVRGWARRAAALGLGLLLTGCSGGSAGPGSTDAAAPEPPRTVPHAQLAVTPADGAQEVPLDGPVTVTVARGRLVSVRLADEKGAEVRGRLGAGGRSWTPDGRLAAATAYTLDAVAEDDEGLTEAQHAAFETRTPDRTFVAFYTPEDGTTVGVGMPVSLRFSRAITDRAAVERAVAVTADPPVPVAGHWFGARRLDFRPERYWAPGTRVTLTLRLKDVQGAPGYVGTQSKSVRFTVGRSQVSTVDLDTRTMTVRQDGRVVRTLKVSAGGPEHPTYLGAMVVSERSAVTRMDSQTVGLGDEYDIKDVPHAMRLTGSGTFVHGNYWSPRTVFGTANTSHGCIGLADVKGGSPDSPAGWFFDHTITGDVVEVRGSAGERVPADNGLNGWNLPWAGWTVRSAPATR
ncbi:Ig-like domain-containing protein [Kitasatospora sp. NPDC048540]|uniref:L,D-transpeptidase n=1 Tax=unclassified Kitasatospora TaxID=2633591 RepID=UPI00068E8B61|nr:Ig-like domain-containing protein [Kitasatospora sp. MBT63]